MQGVRAEFERRGTPFVLTREPGGTALGDEVRQLLLRNEGEAPVAKAEALLYQAGRAQHVEKVIRPALQAGRWVLSDRFAASSLAFQAGGRTIAAAEIEWLNNFSTSGLKPDLYILLDLSVEQSLRRLQSRAQETDRFEREKSDFHERVRRAYLALAQSEPGRWLVLDAGLGPEALLDRTLSTLRGRQWLA